MSIFKDISMLALLAIIAFMSVFRLSTVHDKEIAWDVLGYYLPLPAAFIHDDPMLNSIDWLQELNDEKHLTGTLYMVSSNEEGEPMYFFFLGMSIFYLPFFLLGHAAAFITGMPMDGFSGSYQFSLVVGALIYGFIGLVYLRKILRNYFDSRITAAVLLTIVFSTNYIHHMTTMNLETVNILFMLVCIIVWFTIKWHQEHRVGQLIAICASVTLIGLVKPSEIVIILIPLLWGVQSKEGIWQKWTLIVKHKNQFFKALVVCLLIASPQVIYWLIKTGRPIYDSYKNPGVGLDLLSPHILEVLFSYRKGWLLYTPVMILFLFGFYRLYQKDRSLFYTITIYFLTTFYIISSWSEWWYGAGFSNRPLITTYPLLGICFGYLLVYIRGKSLLIKSSVVMVTLLLTSYNLFQWWQLRTFILNPDRMTKAYYWATFLETSNSEQNKELLSVYRDFGYERSFDKKDKYEKSFAHVLDFQDGTMGEEIGPTPLGYYQVKSEQDFALTRKYHFDDLTERDHIWICMSMDVRFTSDQGDSRPIVVITMDRRGGHYGYLPTELDVEVLNEWQTVNVEFLSPEIRDRDDYVKTYIWNRYNQDFEVDNVVLEIFERKE